MTDKKSGLSRREFLVVGGGAAAALIVAACGGSSSTTTTGAGAVATTATTVAQTTTTVAGAPSTSSAPTTAATTTTAVAREPVTLTFSHWIGGDAQAPFTATFDRLKEITDGRISIEQDTVGWFDHMAQIQTLIAGGNTPDAMMITPWRMDALFNAGQLADLNPFVAADPTTDASEFPEWFWNYAALEGSQFGIPTNAATDVWFYNKTAFEDAGLPLPRPDWTWEEFAVTARALTRGDEFFGAAIFRSSFPLQFAAMYQNGGALMNEDGTRITMTRPESSAGVQWWADLFLGGGVSPKADQAQDSSDSDLFVAQRVAMIHVSSGLLNSLTRSLADAPFEWGFAVEPGRVTRDQWGASNYVSVFEDAPAKPEAYEAISFFASPEAHILRAELGDISAPVRTGAYRDFVRTLSEPDGVELFADQWDLVVKIPWSTPFEQQLFQVYLPEVGSVWDGSRTAADLFAEIEPKMNDMFAA